MTNQNEYKSCEECGHSFEKEDYILLSGEEVNKCPYCRFFHYMNEISELEGMHLGLGEDETYNPWTGQVEKVEQEVN